MSKVAETCALDGRLHFLLLLHLHLSLLCAMGDYISWGMSRDGSDATLLNPASLDRLEKCFHRRKFPPLFFLLVVVVCCFFHSSS